MEGETFRADSKTVGQGIAKLQGMLQAEEATKKSGANHNVIILHDGDMPGSEIASLLFTFTEAHPARFFVFSQDDSLTEMDIDISAICHGVGKDKKICSEIIKGKIPSNSLIKLPSILRAHLVSGKPAEFFLYDDYAALRLFPYVAGSADVVFVDSAHFEGGLKTVKSIAERPVKLIDLQWARLSNWRDSVRAIFDRHAVNALLPQLAEVKIRYERTQGGEVSTAALLVAGWITNQLGLQVMMYSGNTLYVRGLGGKVISILFEECFGSQRGGLESIEMKFGRDVGPNEEHFVRVRAVSGQLLAESSGGMTLARPLEDDSDAALLKRFYLIGESIANFNRALRVALFVVNSN